ncbi:hypothetical protein ABIA06_002477 [Bradyrhizobium yuanmingense]
MRSGKGRGFLVLGRAWLLSLAKFLLTGLILAAFWLGAMHFRDE